MQWCVLDSTFFLLFILFTCLFIEMPGKLIPCEPFRKEGEGEWKATNDTLVMSTSTGVIVYLLPFSRFDKFFFFMPVNTTQLAGLLLQIMQDTSAFKVTADSRVNFVRLVTRDSTCTYSATSEFTVDGYPFYMLPSDNDRALVNSEKAVTFFWFI